MNPISTPLVDRCMLQAAITTQGHLMKFAGRIFLCTSSRARPIAESMEIDICIPINDVLADIVDGLNDESAK